MRKCFSTKHLRYGSFFIVISIKNKPPTSGLRVTLKVAHNPEVGGSNPSPATIRPPYFAWNAVVFLTFHIILQFHKTCFDPILTPIGAAAHRFNSIIWSGFSLFQRDQQTDDISRLVHQVFQHIQFGLIVVLCIAVHEITVCLQQCFKIWGNFFRDSTKTI